MDIKQSFIIRSLQEYNERVIAQMKQAMARKKVKATGEGERSLAYQALVAGGGAMSKLSFKEYLRFVDMGVGRGHPLGSLEKTKIKLQANKKEGEAFIKQRTYRAKKIYSKVAYGNLSYLAAKLAYGYSEEVIAQLKQELENK